MVKAFGFYDLRLLVFRIVIPFFLYPSESALYRNMMVVLCLIEVMIVYFNESFKNVLKRGYYKEFSMTIKHIFFLLSVSSLYLVFTQQGNEYSRITLGLIAPVILFQNSGPIFYKQVRIDKNGKKFNMIKFCSMYKGADIRKTELMKQNRIRDGMMFKFDHNPRVISLRP